MNGTTIKHVISAKVGKACSQICRAILILQLGLWQKIELLKLATNNKRRMGGKKTRAELMKERQLLLPIKQS